MLMSAEENKALVRRFFGELNAGNLDGLDTLLAVEFRLHFDSFPVLDRAGAQEVYAAFLAAFPGIQHEICDLIAEGDRVASRVTVGGTHRGEYQGIPPTGRTISFGAINIHRCAAGMVTEQWVSSDSLSMLQQLGGVPGPDQQSA
jgi:hypothetical protein